MNQHTRKAAGCLVLLVYMAVYTVLAVTLANMLAPHLPMWAQLIYYAIAGIVWVLPLKPLFGWMKRGG